MASSSNGEDATRSSSSSGGGGGISEATEGAVVMKKGPWTAAEDAILIDYVKRNGEGNWNAVQRNSGLLRCGKSCRLRWANHLRPNLKKGAFTAEEERLILELHAKYGNKWARMASQMPGRTDNEIKNYWNTRMKRHQRAGLAIYPSDIQSGELHRQSQRQPRLPRQRKHHHQAKVLDFQNQRTISFNPTSSQPQPFLYTTTTTHQTPIPSHHHQFNFFAEPNNADLSQSYQQPYSLPSSVATRPLLDPIPPRPLQRNSMKQEASEFEFVHLLSSGISSIKSYSGMLDDVLNAAHFGSRENANAKDDDKSDNQPSQPLKKLKKTSTGDEENSSSGLTSIGMRMEEPVVQINPLDDELTSLLDSFPSASPTPQWYRGGTNVTDINDSSSDANGGLELDLTTTTTSQLPSTSAEPGGNGGDIDQVLSLGGSSPVLWHQNLPTIY